MMRLLADENCDRLLVEMLREAGHDVAYVAEIARGHNDEELMRRAQIEGRTILTDDRDFGLLAERQLKRPPGIILMRLDPMGRVARARRAVEVLRQLADGLDHELAVIEPGQVRRRPYRPQS